ncbi:MAG: SAP domain-containing protein, partial [Poseidonia sp.]
LITLKELNIQLDRDVIFLGVADEEDDGDDGEAEDLSKLSVAELKERLKAAGLPVGGKKADLIARLSQEEE